MSMFENESYRWRETYFVLFDARKRPPLEKVRKTLAALNRRFQLSNLTADERGRFESLTLLSPDDFAALDVCYVEGDEVHEQVEQLIAEMRKAIAETSDPALVQRLRSATGRFDVLHFEQINEDEAEGDDMLDPSAMLIVLEVLAKMTDGIAVDPQSGTLVS